MKENLFKNTRIEFHILQSFPVTCLNRDDVGAPKTALVGGVSRARVSSQCWKRQVRLEMRKLGAICGVRTKLICDLIKNACIEEGASEEQANACGNKVSQIFIKKKNKSKRPDEEDSEQEDNDTLIFLSPKEVSLLAQKFKEAHFNPGLVILGVDGKAGEKARVKSFEKILGKDINTIDAVDIALFGRMVARAGWMNVEAAASFSHAISTHKVRNEVEFFTALDDLSAEPGAAHMGSLEFNSATYYRYVSLDLGQLWETLLGHNFEETVIVFVKALFLAVPSARQTTQSGASFWEFAKIFIRQGQRLQVPFETAIKASDGGFLQPSIDGLNSYLVQKEKLAGSLFKKEAEYIIGEGESAFNIDDLIAAISGYIKTKAV
jgi:CRISPR system Cascade subunit CasC